MEIIDRHHPDPPAGPLQVAARLPGEPPFDPAADLRLTLNFKGPTITPEFFPYALDDLSGVLRYQGGKVDLARFAARHGPSHFGLDAAEVRFGPGGEVWANLGGLTSTAAGPGRGLPGRAAGPAADRRRGAEAPAGRWNC